MKTKQTRPMCGKCDENRAYYCRQCAKIEKKIINEKLKNLIDTLPYLGREGMIAAVSAEEKIRALFKEYL